MDENVKKLIANIQKDEITGHNIYLNLAKQAKTPENQKVLENIAAQELAHHDKMKIYTGVEVQPDWGKVRRISFLSRLLGLTFGANLMERGERDAVKVYSQLKNEFPEAEKIQAEEARHEEELISLLDEESLHYAGSIVLGLNDALVELTGTLAGLTFALQSTQLVAVSGLITGIAAALSMAASEFLSTLSEKGSHKKPGKAAIYTGIAYLITVTMLILPYLLIHNVFISLAVMLVIAVFIIMAFTFYSAVVTNESFLKRFGTMAAISLGVALLSFGIGLIVRNVLHVGG
ncbi:MAG TPA: VIT1/CCC1 transporter family protein [Anaerolineaceae bacterium]|nr:VIT1/CCC1 transporter family protein [Anaerolineaceae bacterium]